VDGGEEEEEEEDVRAKAPSLYFPWIEAGIVFFPPSFCSFLL